MQHLHRMRKRESHRYIEHREGRSVNGSNTILIILIIISNIKRIRKKISPSISYSQSRDCPTLKSSYLLHRQALPSCTSGSLSRHLPVARRYCTRHSNFYFCKFRSRTLIFAVALQPPTLLLFSK
jgi:hypothetical protein